MRHLLDNHAAGHERVRLAVVRDCAWGVHREHERCRGLYERRPPGTGIRCARVAHAWRVLAVDPRDPLATLTRTVAGWNANARMNTTVDPSTSTFSGI